MGIDNVAHMRHNTYIDSGIRQLLNNHEVDIMNKSEIFSKAHALVKKVIKAGDNYAVTFSACLKSIYEGLKMVVKTIEEKALEAGAKLWEKGSRSRIYFNDRSILAEVIGYKIVDKAKWAEEMTAGKTKTFLEDGVFHADSGDIANALRATGHKVVRI